MLRGNEGCARAHSCARVFNEGKFVARAHGCARVYNEGNFVAWVFDDLKD